MNKKRMTLVIVMFLVIMIFPSIVANGYAQETTNEMYQDLTARRLFEHPNLESSPTFEIIGDSDKFEFSYLQENDQSGAVYLSWTHEANEELDYPPSNETDGTPDCNEYVYFFYDLEYPFEFSPELCYLDIAFSISLNETFDEVPDGFQMFEIFVAGIDSSNNWVTLFESTSPYTEPNVERQYLSCWNVRELFDGMVEENGYQDDPDDTFSIAVGLSPSRTFLDNNGTHPWQTYNGTVSVEFTSFDFVISGYFGERIERESAIYSGGIDIGENLAIPCDLEIDSSGNIYSVGTYYDENLRIHQAILTKWNPECNLLWKRTFNGLGVCGIGSYACISSDSYLYTIGSTSSTDAYEIDNPEWNYYIAKWSLDGELIWTRYYGDSDLGYYYAYDLDTGEDGYLYANVQDTNGTLSMNSWDLNGDLRWSIPAEGLYIENYQYYLKRNSTHVSKFDLDGNNLWSIHLIADEKLEFHNGSIFAIQSNSTHYLISKVDTDGNTLYTQAIPAYFQYHGLDVCRMNIHSLNVDSEGNIALLLENDWNPYSLLYKMKSNLTIVWSRSLDVDLYHSFLPSTFEGEGEMRISDNGLLYMSVRQTTPGRQWSLLAYRFAEDSELKQIPSELSISIIVTVSSLCVIVVGTYLLVRREQFQLVSF